MLFEAIVAKSCTGTIIKPPTTTLAAMLIKLKIPSAISPLYSPLVSKVLLHSTYVLDITYTLKCVAPQLRYGLPSYA